MKRETIKIQDSNLRQDYISVDLQTAISAEGYVFKVGDRVFHEADEEETVATIQLFDCDRKTNDIIAITHKGKGRISFLTVVE